MNDKSTVGPWRVDHHYMGEYTVAHNDGDIGITYRLQDAHLIAAAPDYDDGARDFVLYEEAMERGDDVKAMLLYASASKKLRAAIAKAEGRK